MTMIEEAGTLNTEDQVMEPGVIGVRTMTHGIGDLTAIMVHPTFEMDETMEQDSGKGQATLQDIILVQTGVADILIKM